MFRKYADPIRNPRIVTGLSETEKKVLECYGRGMKRKEIAALLGFSYEKVGTLLITAQAKDMFLKDIHSHGGTWVGEIPGIPSHCVGALQRNGIFTVSELQEMPEYKILQLYDIGRKGIEAIQRYKKQREAQHT